MKIFLSIVLMLFVDSSFSQNSNLVLDIKVEDDDNFNKPLKDAVVKVYQDHELIVESVTDSLGEIKKIHIPAVGSYIIKVEREGYASKFGTINTSHFDPKYLSGNIKFPMEVGLVKPTETEDYAFLLKEPMITFYLDTSGEQAWDDAYLNKMLDKVKKCQAGWTAEEFDTYYQPKSNAKEMMENQDFAAAKETLLEEGFKEEDVKKELKIYGPVGCDQCANGYKGRVGVYQVLPISDAIAKLIMEGGNAMQIADQAHKDGIPDLRESGLKKVMDGATSLEEINRVTKE